MPVLLKGHEPKPCTCTNGAIDVFWQLSPNDAKRHIFQADGQELLALCGHRSPVDQAVDNVGARPCVSCLQVFNMLLNNPGTNEANADESRWQGGFS